MSASGQLVDTALARRHQAHSGSSRPDILRPFRHGGPTGRQQASRRSRRVQMRKHGAGST